MRFADPKRPIDQFLQNTHQILRYQPAHERDIRSLVNWVKGTGQLAHEETDYLSQQRDLICLASSHDDALTRLEVWIEDKVASFIPCMFRVSRTAYVYWSNVLISPLVRVPHPMYLETPI